MYCSAAVAAAVGQNLTRAHLWAFVFVRLSEKRSKNVKSMRRVLEERSSWELLWSTWIIAFFCTLHSIALIFLPLLPCLTLTLSPALWFLALAGHSAAARLCGSLDFMVAALPLCNDGLVNSGVERHSPQTTHRCI